MFKPVANLFNRVAAKITGRKPAVMAKSPTEKSPKVSKFRTPKVRGARKVRSTDGFQTGQTVQLSWAARARKGTVIAIHTDKLGIRHSHGTVSWRSPSAVRQA